MPASSDPRPVGRIVDPLADEPDSAPAGDVLPPLPGREDELADIARILNRSPEPPGVEPAEVAEPDALAEYVTGDPAETEAVAESPTSPEDVPPVATRPTARGPAMRDLLLAKAGRLEPDSAPSARPRGGLDEIGRDDPAPESKLDHALEQVGQSAHRPPAAPMVRQGATAVSPTLVALFGAILGLATIASLVAVLMRIAPREPMGELGGSSNTLGANPKATASAADSEVQQGPVGRKKRAAVKGPWRVKDGKGQPGTRYIKGKVGREPFLKAVQSAGLSKDQAYRLLKAFTGTKNLDRCKSSDRFIGLVDRKSKKLKAFEYIVSAEEIYQAKEGSDGRLHSKKLDLKLERDQLRGAIAFRERGFGINAKRSGFDSSLSKVVDKAIRGHMALGDMGKGDVLRVVVQEVTVLGEFARYAGIEAMEYLPGGNSSKAMRIYFFRGAKTRGYFDAKGRSPYEGGWRKPIPDARISSRFNPKRMHPVLKRVMPHNGTDFGAAAGTRIGASSFGTISFMGYAGASGNLVKINHPGGVETGYAHMTRFEKGLRVGAKVKRMQTIGYVGSTGRSTGPHLHFSAKRNGKFIDAESLNLDALTVLPSSERADFKAAKAKYDALLDAIPIPAAAAPSAPNSPTEGDDDSDVAVAPGGGTPAGGGRDEDSVYLSDKDLLEKQSRDDDGEVNE